MAAHRGPQAGAAMRWPCNFSVSLVAQDQLITGQYRGGAHIDLYLGQHTSGIPFDTINVYDYETDKPRIEFTRAAVSEQIKEWRQELYPHEIENHIANAR